MKQYKRHIAHNEEPNQYLIGREDIFYNLYITNVPYRNIGFFYTWVTLYILYSFIMKFSL